MARVTPDQLMTLSIALLALALLIAGGLLIVRELQNARSSRAIGRAIEHGMAAPSQSWQPAGHKSQAARTPAEDEAGARTPDLPVHWLQTRMGRALVADEDKRLIDQAGFVSARAQLAFFVTRLGLAAVLPAFGYFIVDAGLLKVNATLVLAFGCGLGFMLPKWVLTRIAASRREEVANELPLFVDLLRLLQGVGLSLDQSLQIMADDFGHVLKVLSRELKMANRQYAQGRTREHSLQRLATLYDSESLGGLVALLVQVDRHGGAIQEPLHQFSERLREARRAELKARIGKITVKMTAIMVTTLLPALVIVTAGPGFLAIFRALGGMAR